MPSAFVERHYFAMQRSILTLLVTAFAASLIAQTLSYDPKGKPPIALPEAYSLVISNLAKYPSATNRFHCISASCAEMSGSNGWTGWTFWFSNTNGDRARMRVFFDGEVTAENGDYEFSQPCVSVLGEFRTPGYCAWTNGMTLADGIAAAGGFTPLATRDVRLTHRGGSNEFYYRSGPQNTLTNNPVLRPNDLIYSRRRIHDW